MEIRGCGSKRDTLRKKRVRVCGRIGEIRMNGNNGLGGEVWGMDNRKGGECYRCIQHVV